MRKHHVYNKDMNIGEESCAHAKTKRITFSTTYIMYDGVEEYVTKGRVCVVCGTLVEGNREADDATVNLENNLLNLLGK